MATITHDLDPGAARYKSTNPAILVSNTGTNFPVSALKFDATDEQDAFWALHTINYGSGNATVTVDWYASTGVISGDVVWAAQLAAITPDSDSGSVETKAFATANTTTDTHLGTTAKRLHRATITVSNLDALAVNDAVWLRLARQAGAGGDTLAGFVFATGVLFSYSDT